MIEDLKTKGDLERFIEEQLQSIDVTQINGLADTLAARTATRFPASAGVALTEAAQAIPGAKFTAPMAMTCLAIGIFDGNAPTGTGLGQLQLNGVTQTQQAIFAASRSTVSQNWPLTLKAKDVVELFTLRVAGAGGAVAETFTGLTIVRLT